MKNLDRNKYLKGCKVEIINTYGLPTKFKKGDIVIIDTRIDSYNEIKIVGYSGWVKAKKFKPYEPVENEEQINKAIEKLQVEKTKIQDKIDLFKSKIAFMKETNTEVFDETLYQSYQILSIVDSKNTKLEKSQAIAKLLKK